MPVNPDERNDAAYNPNRTADLFALTQDGYFIAQDVACQSEFVAEQPCPECGEEHTLRPIAHINRAFQGLNEIVIVCRHCYAHTSYIFDISNEVYQSWWGEIMGEAYVRTFDGPPRHADPNRRYFR